MTSLQRNGRGVNQTTNTRNNRNNKNLNNTNDDNGDSIGDNNIYDDNNAKPGVVGKSVPEPGQSRSQNKERQQHRRQQIQQQRQQQEQQQQKQQQNQQQQQQQQQPKKKPSLVKEGIDSNNKPIPKPRPPKTQTQTRTPRGITSKPNRPYNNNSSSYNYNNDNDNDDDNNNLRNTMRDGDADSNNYNNATSMNGDGLSSPGDGGDMSLNGGRGDVMDPHQKVPNQRPTKGGGYKGKPAASEIPSVRQRFYDSADMDDVLQDKIAHQLRENGVSETKVAFLSARIAQAVRDDVMMERKASTPTVVSNLSSAIADHLDVILHNSRHHTDLSHVKAHDASKLSEIVLNRVAQVHEELDTCKSALDAALQQGQGQGQPSSRKQQPAKDRFHATTTSSSALDGGEEEEHETLPAATTSTTTTPRGGGGGDGQRDRSLVLTIKDGIDKQKTQKEIALDQLSELQRNRDDVDQLNNKHTQEVQMWDDENLTLKKYLTEADQDNETLVAKVKEQQQDNDKLQKSLQASRKDIERLHKQIEEMVSQGHVSGKELAALQSEKARLQVLCEQRYKEIIHLRDPDKDLLQQIRVLKDDVTSLRTQTRRLSEEKGLLKAKTQKMEAALDESLKQRNKITSERDAIFKENQEVRSKFRKLSLATPAQRTLPEIMTPRTRASSRNATTLLNNASTRTNSRADSSLRNNGLSDDSTNNINNINNNNKLPTHVEEINNDDPAHI